MKNSHGLITGIGLLLVVTILSGCVAGPDKTIIYDDAEMVAQDGDSYSYQSRTEESLYNKSLNLKYRGFSGVETLWTLEVTGQAQGIVEIDSTVEYGDFKVVLIDPEKLIQLIQEGSGRNSFPLQLEQGNYLLKIVGRQAAGALEVRIEADENVQLIRADDF